MISHEETVTFLWRCSGCPAVYDAESVASLLHDGTSRACFCGGSLIEDIGPAPERDREADSGWNHVGRYRAMGLLRSL
ncbi:hypothetical protein GBA63_14540 [Rubrobacter tropicus]|uniref:Uncharacterized protein n=1 Tax=Rubrobacter tropicus TaxID=2653851 RepID=A0A6G8QBA3_9ACTN|nr:hypothetical protein [Rubrobacter tropicus]QIN83713.1 hypothetical protein GBA63_14540 [Rubrobacter tropicus]